VGACGAADFTNKTRQGVANSFLILAQAAPGGSNPLSLFGFMAVMVGIMYFLMIRPQQKQLKEHRNLIASLKKGDEVVTQGGMIGRIHALTERTVTLEVAAGVRVRVLKTSVASRGAVPEEATVVAATTTAAPPKSEEKKEEK
jgi:preprotein translocase subunit YajC